MNRAVVAAVPLAPAERRVTERRTPGELALHPVAHTPGSVDATPDAEDLGHS